MFCSTTSFVLDGISARPVRVEADVHRGLPGFAVVGLPDGAAREARERIRAAMIKSGFEFPLLRIVVNLAPASLRKAGPPMDLAIAAALLGASGQLDREAVEGMAFVGELALDGGVRPVAGALAMAESARDAGIAGIVVPRRTVPRRRSRERCAWWRWRASRASRPWVRRASPVADAPGAAVGAATGRSRPRRPADPARPAPGARGRRGGRSRPSSRRAAGTGQVPRREPPALDPSADGRGRGPGGDPHRRRRRAPRVGGARGPPLPRASSCDQRGGLLGGGLPPRPGEVTLAHRGVLFLDELEGFRRDVTEALRAVLDAHEVVFDRGAATAGSAALRPAVAVMPWRRRSRLPSASAER